ncbi:hypothetical protein [Burkholderia sp. Ac-20365]|uniref:hypothetical protein n=1 Tax=Burkholderia sp. Ac-20365 TaxID=2703897 RepID=UPI001F11E77B|nr:hypothetical protein [Burkholderia sp. Ac-20365]
MPWPIPTYKQIQRPKPISARTWLPALTAIALGLASSILLLWPHGKPTQGIQFWALLIGLPLVTCALAFGIRLDRWEREQTIADEAEREQARIRALWRDWCARHIRVVSALAILPIPARTATLNDANTSLPVNTGRAKSFPWTSDKTDASRRMALLSRIAADLRTSLANRQAMSIRLMLDDASLAFADAWKDAARSTFSAIMPGCNLNIEVEQATGCAQWLTEQVDIADAAPQLVIAAQIWTDGEPQHNFSESAAALLIDPAATPASGIFRPIIVGNDTLEADLSQLQEMQIAPAELTHVWFSRCDDESAAMTASLASGSNVIERQIDNIVGIPGPATSWVALATALEAAQGTGVHLVAWRESGDDRLNLCMIAPSKASPAV